MPNWRPMQDLHRALGEAEHALALETSLSQRAEAALAGTREEPQAVTPGNAPNHSLDHSFDNALDDIRDNATNDATNDEVADLAAERDLLRAHNLETMAELTHAQAEVVALIEAQRTRTTMAEDAAGREARAAAQIDRLTAHIGELESQLDADDSGQATTAAPAAKGRERGIRYSIVCKHSFLPAYPMHSRACKPLRSATIPTRCKRDASGSREEPIRSVIANSLSHSRHSKRPFAPVTTRL
jgi:hypothetical protein